MSRVKILNVYKWATMGGVERVLLNRAHSLQANGINVQFDVCFLHDSGGKIEFINYINNNGLKSMVNVVDKIDQSIYDLFFSIDTPEIFDMVDPKKVYIECHTSYEKNRSYLKYLPDDVKGILVPSRQFKEEINIEISEKLLDRLYVLSNNVYVKKQELLSSKVFEKTPIVYIGRIDILKNVEEIIKIISIYNAKFGDKLILILAGNIIEHEINLNKIIKKHKMSNRTVYLPPMNFDKVWELLQFVKSERGLFISASLRESFGLSVAEAMAFGLPSLILKNKAHQHLVNNDKSYLFDGNDYEQAVNNLHDLIMEYDKKSETIMQYSDKLKDDFINEFKQLIY